MMTIRSYLPVSPPRIALRSIRGYISVTPNGVQESRRHLGLIGFDSAAVRLCQLNPGRGGRNVAPDGAQRNPGCAKWPLCLHTIATASGSTGGSYP